MPLELGVHKKLKTVVIWKAFIGVDMLPNFVFQLLLSQNKFFAYQKLQVIVLG